VGGERTEDRGQRREGVRLHHTLHLNQLVYTHTLQHSYATLIHYNHTLHSYAPHSYRDHKGGGALLSMYLPPSQDAWG
jgi:hypothetical protein